LKQIKNEKKNQNKSNVDKIQEDTNIKLTFQDYTPKKIKKIKSEGNKKK
jgi:hypothetical protein